MNPRKRNSRGGRGSLRGVVSPERPKQGSHAPQLSLNTRRSKSVVGPSSNSTLSPPSSTASDRGLVGSTPRGSRATSRSATSGVDNGVSEDGGVRVAVRVRPLTQEEKEKGGERVLRCRNPKELELMNSPFSAFSGSESRVYMFDLCAHEGFSQEEMFSSCGLMPLLKAAVDGYAGTIFAYGTTGAGKTYTMSGREQQVSREQGTDLKGIKGRVSPDRSDGLIQRSMRYIFQTISSLPATVQLRIRASYCEIYNEVVFDLLNREKKPLQVRYNTKRGFFVQGLFEVEIHSLEDIMAVVDEGNGNRRVSAHLLNQDSSRSHSLLTVYLQSEWCDEEDGHLIRKFGKVAFVDLAGSERIKRSQARDEKETGSINKSLMTLGKVISALGKQGLVASTNTSANAAGAATAATSASGYGEGATAALLSTPVGPSPGVGPLMGVGSGGLGQLPAGGLPGFPSSSTLAPAPVSAEAWVPYRDSTLTKLLMDSLGGNGLTLMVACVSPSADHAEESAATLNYAARARNIRNRPRMQLDPREALIAALRREVALLRMENSLLRGESMTSTGSGPPPAATGLRLDDRSGGGDGGWQGGNNGGLGGRGESWKPGLGGEATTPGGQGRGIQMQMEEGGRGGGGTIAISPVRIGVGGCVGEGMVQAMGSRIGQVQGSRAGVRAEEGGEGPDRGMKEGTGMNGEVSSVQVNRVSREAGLLLEKYEEEVSRHMGG